MKEEKIQRLTKALTPGLCAIILLMIIQKPEIFFQWMQDKTIIYTISMFFYVPIAKILINERYDRGYTAPIILGIAMLIPYALLVNLTLEEVVITLLQTIVVISIYSTIFHLIEEEVKKL